MAHQKTKLFVASSIKTVKTAVVVWTTSIIGVIVLTVVISPIISNFGIVGTDQKPYAKVDVNKLTDVGVGEEIKVDVKASLTSYSITSGSDTSSIWRRVLMEIKLIGSKGTEVVDNKLNKGFIHYCDQGPATTASFDQCFASFTIKFSNPGKYSIQVSVRAGDPDGSFTFNPIDNLLTSPITITVGDPIPPPPPPPPKPKAPSVSVVASPKNPICTEDKCEPVTITATGIPGDSESSISSVSLWEDGGASYTPGISSVSITRSDFKARSDGVTVYKTFKSIATASNNLQAEGSVTVALMVPKSLTGTLGISFTKLGGTISIIAKLNNKDAKVNLELVPGSGDESLLKSTSFATQNCKSNDGKTCSAIWNIPTDGNKPNPTNQTYTFKATFTTSDGKQTTATANLIIKKKEALQCPF